MHINIIEYFIKTVQDLPEKTAIIDGERTISFGELAMQVKRLAARIVNDIDEINKPVAVFLQKSIESVVADIAITYSGNCYMNLDVKAPVLRINSILEQISPVLIISDSENIKILKQLNLDFKVVCIDMIGDYEQDSEVDLQKQLRRIIDTDPLCIINTSGSTGTPKGVVLNYKSYIDYTEWAISTFNFTGDEILGVLSPIIFDHYNFEICLMMSTGASLVLLDNALAGFPVKILEVLQKHKINFIFWVPTIMVNIANMDLLSKIRLPELKMIWFAGEVFPTKSFNYWKKWLPLATFVNLYGPVETTVDCTYFIIDRELSDDEPIPIGKPCRNTDILILNDINKPVKIKEEGEICVRGTSLAMGYYNNGGKTSDAFVQNPLNTAYTEFIYRTGDIGFFNERGEIIFKGRKDTMIKHMGYRIELGEIEHVIINNLQMVNNACVVYNSNKKEIILFFESTNDITVADFRRKLAEFLPKYMIPSVFIRVSELPRNSSGKIDRLQLSRSLNNSSKD